MGCNTSLLIDTLEGAFGSIDQETISLVSIPEVKETVMEDVPSTPSPTDSGPLEVELVFPTPAFPLVIAGIPESLLPICADLKHSHAIDAKSLTVLRYSCKKQQPVLMFAVTI